MNAAAHDASSTPIFAASSSTSSVNASAPMNRDIVNPMPPSQLTPRSMRQLTPSGSVAIRMRTASHAASEMPSGLPSTRPTTIPASTVAEGPLDTAPPIRTPAFASAKSGTTRNATGVPSACSSFSSSELSASGALAGMVSASSTPAIVAWMPDERTATQSTTPART